MGERDRTAGGAREAAGVLPLAQLRRASRRHRQGLPPGLVRPEPGPGPAQGRRSVNRWGFGSVKNWKRRVKI